MVIHAVTRRKRAAGLRFRARANWPGRPPRGGHPLAGEDPGQSPGGPVSDRGAGELLGGLVLIAVGIAVASGILQHARLAFSP